MTEKILMRGKFESWDQLLLQVKSKVSGKRPEEVSKIVITPNQVEIYPLGKSVSCSE